MSKERVENRSNTLLVLGASSEIARSVAEKYAMHGWSLVLVARDRSALETQANALRKDHNVESSIYTLDVQEEGAGVELVEKFGEVVDAVFCAVGYLGDQQKAQSDWREAERIMFINFVGLVRILDLFASRFEKAQSGALIVISSVAGGRGRQSNYYYGASKAGLTAYLSGLRNRLHKTKVQVLEIRPGFVATRMIEGMELPKILTASTKSVATTVFESHRSSKDIVYVKPVWRYIMTVIKLIPESIFKRLDL